MATEHGKSPTADRQFLTRREAAEWLRSSVDTLDRRKDRGEIPFYDPGGVVLFALDDLEAYMRAHRVEAVDAWDI